MIYCVVGTGGTGSTCATTDTIWITGATSASSTCATDTIWITTTGTGTSTSCYATGLNNVQQALLQQQLIRQQTNQYNQALNHQQLVQNQQELHQYNRYARVQEEEMHAARERAAQLVEEQGEARKRAHALLLEHLTPQQRETFEKNKWFIVEGGKTGKRFKIFSNGYAGNVHELDAHDRMVNRLCCHANPGIPLEDQLLTQKVLLEWDEEHFYKTANITRIAA